MSDARKPLLRRCAHRIRGFVANRLGILPEFTLACDGSLAALGWPRSWRSRRSEDAHGEPLPWFTYPAIRFLAQRMPPGQTVFEYGAGNSTLWWSRRAAAVIACEHDRVWSDALLARAPANVRIVPSEDGPSYEASIAAIDPAPGLVVIDGIRREACLRAALIRIPADGVVVWDNAEREDATRGAAALRSAGWRELAFWGFGPIATYEWCTSIWYRDGNLLGI